ncbi:class II fructose-bisphosphate aldolase [Eubacteriales bacterium OttesenSCG-928-N13]|nr:class II fructose-bisphosphate aldolase [Eubacteriales bacterium OttesenSCG-928-N13]
MIVTERAASKKIFEKAAEQGVSIAIFCTASYWNTEAILLASQRLKQKHNLPSVPVVVATTFTYKHMPQCRRFTHSDNERAGFLSHMAHMRALTDGKYAPYGDVTVLPHLDHADPERDGWALNVPIPYFSSVMFDAQRFPLEQNIQMTKQYVQQYGDQVLIEGIMEMLNVEGGATAKQVDNYAEQAARYVEQTGVDFFVADLGTEQQTSSVGNAKYNQQRAKELTSALGKKMLVLHGTSCLTNDQVKGLIDDGVARVNMWTRIVRESGQYAAEQLVSRMDQVRAGHFDSAESYQYMLDNVEKAADIMVEMMELFGYANWKG